MATRVRIGSVGASYREDGLDSVARGDAYAAAIEKTRVATHDILSGAVGMWALSILPTIFYALNDPVSRSNPSFGGFCLVTLCNMIGYAKMSKLSGKNLDCLAALATAIRTNQVSGASVASFHTAKEIIPSELYRIFFASSVMGSALLGEHVQQLSDTTDRAVWSVIWAMLVAQTVVLAVNDVRTKNTTRKALQLLTSPADQPVAVLMSDTAEDDDDEDDEEEAGVIDLRPKRFAVGKK